MTEKQVWKDLESKMLISCNSLKEAFAGCSICEELSNLCISSRMEAKIFAKVMKEGKRMKADLNEYLWPLTKSGFAKRARFCSKMARELN